MPVGARVPKLSWKLGTFTNKIQWESQNSQLWPEKKCEWLRMTFLACYSDSKPLPENSLKWCQSVPGSPNWAGSLVLLLISVNEKAKIPNYGLTNFRMTTNDIFGMLFRPRTIAWKQSQVVPVGARVPKLSCKLDTFTNNSQWGGQNPQLWPNKFPNDYKWHFWHVI